MRHRDRIVSEGKELTLQPCSYFRRLNVTVAVLDPFIHTPSYCRARSPFLFTAILTVASKTIRASVYPSCLILANRLFGRICELGLVSLEIVQALNVLTHWKKADDMSSWTRIGLAIRMAQELRLNVRGKRPLPGDERQAREILVRRTQDLSFEHGLKLCVDNRTEKERGGVSHATVSYHRQTY